jgi:hypothetical protein
VGHGNDRAFILLQVALQPGNRFGVEVVGGFIEQQDVGLGQQQAAQRHPAALAAREHFDGRIARRAAQGIHRQFQAVIERPGVVFLQFLVEARLFFDQRVEISVRFAKLVIDFVVCL